LAGREASLVEAPRQGVALVEGHDHLEVGTAGAEAERCHGQEAAAQPGGATVRASRAPVEGNTAPVSLSVPGDDAAALPGWVPGPWGRFGEPDGQPRDGRRPGAPAGRGPEPETLGGPTARARRVDGS
jgi:hypothetical protein